METKPSQGQIAEFCQRHHIRRLSLFGSVLREDFGPQNKMAGMRNRLIHGYFDLNLALCGRRSRKTYQN